MLSLYFSLPFCRHKCSYCDLNAYAGLDDLIPSYMAALIQETRLVGSGISDKVHTVYFGGGTPSIIPLSHLGELFATIRSSFALTDPVEISFEANPETLDAAYLAGLRDLGVTRLSVGAQSAQPNELALFQRTHTFAQVQQAVALARQAGFDNLSLDLIYGIPGQTLSAWQDSLMQALALQPDHFSIYALSYDFETPMRAWIRRGLLAEPDDDLAAEMYAWADETLAAAGYGQYEISSWARKPQFNCRHNLQYWHNQPYLGLGAGAHGYYAGQRYANVASPTAYVTRMREGQAQPLPFSSALQTSIPVDRETEMNETMLTGLRLVQEGVAEADFAARFGATLPEAFGATLDELTRRGLLAYTDGRLRLTPQARLVSNWVFEKFV